MSDSKVVSVGEWIVTFILFAIPIVNVIYVIALLLGAGNKNKVNMIRAGFVMVLISILITIVSMLLFGGVISQYLDEIIAKIQEIIGSFSK